MKQTICYNQLAKCIDEYLSCLYDLRQVSFTKVIARRMINKNEKCKHIFYVESARIT